MPDDLVEKVEAKQADDHGRHVHHPGQRGRAGRRPDRRPQAVGPWHGPRPAGRAGTADRGGGHHQALRRCSSPTTTSACRCSPGEVHALLGENGAGKSTLTKILYGLSQPDAGELRVDGRAVYLRSPKDAMRAGVGMVTQEFSLVGPMTVTENVMLARVGYGPVDRRTAGDAVAAAAARLGVDVRPDAVVEQLSVGERQRVEIVKALFNDCRVLDPRRADGRARAPGRRPAVRVDTSPHRDGHGRAVHLAQAARGDGDRRPGDGAAPRSPRGHPAGGRSRPRRHRRADDGRGRRHRCRGGDHRRGRQRAAERGRRGRAPPPSRPRCPRRRRSRRSRSATSPWRARARRASTVCRSRCRPARSSAWPASAATARPSSSTCCVPASTRRGARSPIAGHDVTALDAVRTAARRARPDHRGPPRQRRAQPVGRAEPRARGPRPLLAVGGDPPPHGA